MGSAEELENAQLGEGRHCVIFHGKKYEGDRNKTQDARVSWRWVWGTKKRGQEGG